MTFPLLNNPDYAPLPNTDPLLEAQRDTDWYELLPDNASSNVLSASIVIGNARALYGFTVNNTNASAQFILLFDSTKAAATNDAPAASFVVDGSKALPIEYIRPRKIRRGIVLMNSSTADKLTAGAADCWFDVQYK